MSLKNKINNLTGKHKLKSHTYLIAIFFPCTFSRWLNYSLVITIDFLKKCMEGARYKRLWIQTNKYFVKPKTGKVAYNTKLFGSVVIIVFKIIFYVEMY